MCSCSDNSVCLSNSDFCPWTEALIRSKLKLYIVRTSLVMVMFKEEGNWFFSSNPTSKQCHWITTVCIRVIIFTVSHVSSFHRKDCWHQQGIFFPWQLNQFVPVTLPPCVERWNCMVHVASCSLFLLKLRQSCECHREIYHRDKALLFVHKIQLSNAALQMSWQIHGTVYCHGNCRQSWFTSNIFINLQGN